MSYYLFFALLLVGAACHAGGKRPVVEFLGACDASGAVPLSDTEFMIADDENNVLRVYNVEQGGLPVRTLALSETINPKLPPSAALIPENKELDLEAATRVGNISFWLTSHARNKKGKFKPERFQFIALEHNGPKQVTAYGKPYGGLLEAMVDEPQYQALGLRAASEKAAEEVGGLNIEGMTAAISGGVFIGFRNPLSKNQAIIVTLKNPEQVARNEPPVFGRHYLLDLGGLGIRGLSVWQGDYFIAAGGATSHEAMQLFRWRVGFAPVAVELGAVPHDFNPEAFFTPESRNDIMLLSDDGARQVAGVACKKLKDPNKQSFRGIWLDFNH